MTSYNIFIKKSPCILWVLLLFYSNYSKSNTINDSYYNVSNFNLKISKTPDNNLIFYGDHGCILRSSDNGLSWEHQNSKINNWIKKLVVNDSYIFGISFNDQLIKSNNDGLSWEIIESYTLKELNSITTLGSNIYLSNYFRSISRSSDNGKTWKNYNIDLGSTNDSILNIESSNGNILLQTVNGDVYFSDETLSNWYLLAINEKLMKKKNHRIYFYDSNSFNYLEEDLSINKTVYQKNYNNYYPSNNEVYALRSDPNLKRIILDKYIDDSKSHVNIIDTILPFLDQPYFQNLDIELDNNNFFLSNLGKTIFNINLSDSTIELISNFPYFISQPQPFIYDNNRIIIPGKYQFYTSKDKGATFQITNYNIVDSANTEQSFIFFKSLFCLDSNNYLFSFNNRFGDAYSFYTEDFFKTFQAVNNEITANSTYMYRNKDVYAYKHIARDKQITFYKINPETFTVNELITIDSISYGTINFVRNKDHLFFSYSYNYVNQNNITKNGIKIFRSDLDFLNLELINDIKEYSLSIPHTFVNFDGNIFTSIFSQNPNNLSDYKRFLYKYTQESNTFELFNDTTLYNISTKNMLNPNEGYVINSSDTLCLYKQLEDEDQISYLVKLSLVDNDSRFLIDTIVESRIKLPYHKSFKGDINLYSQSHKNIWLPINDSLITNVENALEGPPILWLYPPYPNPVKDRLRMRFYSSLIHNIQNLEVQLINIGSGKLYKIYNYDYIPENGYFGFLEFNISNYLPGAYILNLKLGGESKSELIIIE